MKRIAGLSLEVLVIFSLACAGPRQAVAPPASPKPSPGPVVPRGPLPSPETEPDPEQLLSSLGFHESTVHHTVVYGETLFSISRSYEIAIEELMDANPGVEAATLRPGQLLDIPRIWSPLPDEPDAVTQRE